jgi:dihydroorotase-like cyclic amidohydrolase
VDMAGANPRALLGLPPRELAVGQPAELILFDWQPGGAFQLRGLPGNTLPDGRGS